MKIIVDHERCEGHGLCEASAPEVYQLDDEGELHLLVEEVPDRLEDAASAGAWACPVAALRVEQS